MFVNAKILVSAAAVLCLALPLATSANAAVVTIPDPSPNPFINYGSGDVSVVFDGVTFTQSSTLSDGTLFNVGSLFSGSPAVLSSQEQTVGIPNILVTLPSSIHTFSVNFGTFDGSDVTFLLSNGDTFTLGSTISGYAVPQLFSVSDANDFLSVLITSADPILNINNIHYSASAAVPEPITLTLFGAGLAGIAATRRRKKKSA